MAICAWADSAVIELDVRTPRAFGYVIGDTFNHEIRIELREPYRLDRDSVPTPGKVNRWVELRTVSTRTTRSTQSTTSDIVLGYQIFYSASAIANASIPARTLSIVGPGDKLLLTVPEWEFSVSPVMLQARQPGEEVAEPRPPRDPPPIPTSVLRLRAALLGCLLAASLLFLAYARWGLPFMRRGNAPFARAYRQLKHLQRRSVDQPVYREGLKRVHRAFNETSGEALFADGLHGFYARHPRYAALQSSIDRLYEESRQVFFTDDTEPDEADRSLTQLIRLCRACRDLERRRA